MFDPVTGSLCLPPGVQYQDLIKAATASQSPQNSSSTVAESSSSPAAAIFPKVNIPGTTVKSTSAVSSSEAAVPVEPPKEDVVGTPLFEAVKANNLEAVKRCIETGAGKVNETVSFDECGSVFAYAARAGFWEIVEYMLTKGACPSSITNNKTPLDWAMGDKKYSELGNDHQKCVQILLKNHAASHYLMSHEYLHTVIGATKRNRLDLVRWWIETVEVDVNTRSQLDCEWTILMEAVNRDHLEVVEYLLSKGAAVNATTSSLYSSHTGLTALNIAVDSYMPQIANGSINIARPVRVKIISLLLQAGGRLANKEHFIYSSIIPMQYPQEQRDAVTSEKDKYMREISALRDKIIACGNFPLADAVYDNLYREYILDKPEGGKIYPPNTTRGDFLDSLRAEVVRLQALNKISLMYRVMYKASFEALEKAAGVICTVDGPLGDLVQLVIAGRPEKTE